MQVGDGTWKDTSFAVGESCVLLHEGQEMMGQIVTIYSFPHVKVQLFHKASAFTDTISTYSMEGGGEITTPL